jgi:hypothetical protein
MAFGGSDVTATALIRTCASAAYALTRAPFVLVDHRLPDGSVLRRREEPLGTLDALVRGLLDERTAQRPDPAGPPAPDEAPPVPERDIRREQEAIAREIRRRQPDVGELADPDLDVAEVQAELEAKHIVEAREEARARGEDNVQDILPATPPTS